MYVLSHAMSQTDELDEVRRNLAELKEKERLILAQRRKDEAEARAREQEQTKQLWLRRKAREREEAEAARKARAEAKREAKAAKARDRMRGNQYAAAYTSLSQLPDPELAATVQWWQSRLQSGTLVDGDSPNAWDLPHSMSVLRGDWHHAVAKIAGLPNHPAHCLTLFSRRLRLLAGEQRRWRRRDQYTGWKIQMVTLRSLEKCREHWDKLLQDIGKLPAFAQSAEHDD